MKYNTMASTPNQRQRLDERQVQNNAGGFTYQVSDEDRLRRFLILGTEGGTYYAKQGDHTRQALTFLSKMARENPTSYWTTLHDVATNNLAARHSPALYALAVLRRNTDQADVLNEVRTHFNNIVRTGTHLFEYVDYDTSLGGWGRGLRSLVSSWYVTKDADKLAYQGVKYRQRGGWTHRDLLRKAHPTSTDPAVKSVLDYLAHGKKADPDVPSIVHQFEGAQSGLLAPDVAHLLTWEMLPTDTLREAKTWQSLVQGDRIPLGATLRNLGRMTTNGALDDTATLDRTLRRLADTDAIRKARIHPFNALTAMKTYSSGHGFRGSLIWTPKPRVMDALSELFHLSFQNVEPTGKRTLVAVDVSGSMGQSLMDSNVSAMEGSVAMALTLLAGAPDTTDVVAFSDGTRGGGWPRIGRYSQVTPLALSPRQRLDDALRMTQGLSFNRTDCALPMLHATAQAKEYDAFVVLTDNETWFGSVHPMQALKDYRSKFVKDARLAVVGMTATEFTVGDPADPGTLDVAGFDASAPRLISDFIAGKF